MPDKEDKESRPFLPPEAETPLLNPTSITAARCHSLPSLLLPSSTPHPTMRPSGSLFLSPQAKERPILKSSRQPTISILPTRARKRRRDRMDDVVYLIKYTLLLVILGIGGGFLVWLAMRLTSTGTDNTPLYFSSVDPEDRELCGSPGGRIRNRRIVGGDQSDYAEWPWMVSLESNQTFGRFRHYCGGVLISKNLVITAAHCVEFVRPSNVSNLRLRLGDHDRESNKEPDDHIKRGVVEIKKHPQFNRKSLENDIAVLKIEGEPLVYQTNILPICLPEHHNQLAGKISFITGWGANRPRGQASRILNEAPLPILSNFDCMLMFIKSKKGQRITKNFVCAGTEEGERDACEGDSGGPLVIKGEEERWQLAGISSWGNGCGARNRPGVYTRISHFQSWIHQTAQALQ